MLGCDETMKWLKKIHPIGPSFHDDMYGKMEAKVTVGIELSAFSRRHYSLWPRAACVDEVHISKTVKDGAYGNSLY